MQLSPEVEALFFVLADLPPDERKRYLTEHRISEQLRTDVESLLAFGSPDGNELDELVGHAMQHAVSLTESQTSQQSCGPYRLIRLLGRGGMGAVYLAERDDGEVRQQVAIKVLNTGFRTPQLIERFHQERQILADLS
ncbi:MAG: hypothetical protein WA324_28420, partial [Bryobacteraceae bacterium]